MEMTRQTALRVAAGLAAAVGGVLWYRGGGVLAAASTLVTVVLPLISTVAWMRKKLPDSQPLPRRHVVGILGGGGAALLLALLVPATALHRGTPSGSPSPTEPYAAAGPTSSPTVTDSPSPTLDPGLVEYCEHALEFLGHAQVFSGKGWQGKITQRDFDPIVRTADAALATAPQEMRAPMTVLASSYRAAQDGWSDESMLENAGLLVGTILSPAARAATDAVDSYEDEHCF